MKTRFYDVHVFYNRKDGYSIGVKVESTNPLTEDQILKVATIGGQLDEEDAEYVDYIEEITEAEYKLLKP